MSNAFRRVRPGEPVAIAAAAWNRVIDQVVVRPQYEAAGTGYPQTTFQVRIRNTSTGTVPRWGVLEIAGVLEMPSGPTGPGAVAFQAWPGLVGAVPTSTADGAFAIAVEPIKAGKIGMAAVDGVVQVKLDIKDAGHRFAIPKTGSTSELQTASSGEAVILWKENGTGTGKWGLVRIGSGKGSQVRIGKYEPTGVTGPWSINTTQDVQIYETGTPPSETATAGEVITGVVNHSQAVQPGSWVLVGKGANGYWYMLEAPESTSLVRLGKYEPTGTTGPWSMHTTQDIQVYENGTPPSETITTGEVITGVVNHTHDVPHGSWVLCGQAANGYWYMIESENRTTGCHLVVGGTDLSLLPGFDQMEVQLLGHTAMTSGPSGPEGCASLQWYSVTNCTGPTGATGV